MLSRKRRRIDPPTIHPNNRYSEKPPDFRLLASLYPSFRPYVFQTARGRAAIDWTDFSATRELTRVLLHHDHGLEWWIPDRQLCPTVPNRLNYVHWIGDLLSSDILPKKGGGCNGEVRGFDIGTGANCIYPLLGASLFGWKFVGSDVTEVALKWAKKNVEHNPHVSHLIEIRDAANEHKSRKPVSNLEAVHVETAEPDVTELAEEHLLDTMEPSVTEQAEENLVPLPDKYCYDGPPILTGVIECGEEFDFCMCNPPFFERMEEASLNPKTSCGGTYEEMVCPGGEQAFISRIIEDSAELKYSFRWYTSMVGRKGNLKLLVAKLRDVGASVVKTTEFVQGHTARWGLAWSFLPSNKKPVPSNVTARNYHSFTLEGLQRKCGAFQVLKATELYFINYGSTCKSDLSAFFIDIKISTKQLHSLLKDDLQGAISLDQKSNKSDNQFPDEICFRISIFEQIPGTILVKGSLQKKDGPFSGIFSALIQNVEGALKEQFLKKSC